MRVQLCSVGSGITAKYSDAMLRRTAFTSVLAACVLAGASPAVADPELAPPPIPNTFAYRPVNPANYTVNGGRWFAFAGPPGVVCVLDTINGEYGCSGPLPGAPGGANLVSAGPNGMPAFTTTEILQYAKAGAVLPLPPNTRLSYRQVACGVDDAGVVACLNTRDQVGLVVGPNGSFAASNAPAPVSPAVAAPA